jgi:outer membrane protein assembly factor BamB
VDDNTGQVKWTFDQASSALPTAPAYAQETLYLNALDGHVYAVDAPTGQVDWQQEVKGSIWGSPLVYEDTVYLGTLDGVIYALDVQDGQIIWSTTIEGQVRGTPAYVNGKIYIGCENGRLYVFDALDGAESASPLGMALEKTSIYTAPVFDGQHLYIVATDGTVYALDLEKNVIVWQNNPLTAQEEK